MEGYGVAPENRISSFEKKQDHSAPSFIVVSLRYLGDVLLSTPLALSIKKCIPGAIVDYLVFEGMEAILEKNPLVRTVHTMPRGSKSISRYVEMWKKYDYSIAANASDRATIQCIGTGRFSIGWNLRGEWWRRLLLKECFHYCSSIHFVPNVLSLLEPLKIPPHPRVVMGYDDSDLRFVEQVLGSDPYVLFHPFARVRYKYWSPGAWGSLARIIQETLGWRVVITVTPVADDRIVLNEILSHSPQGIRSLPNPFTFTQLAAAIKRSRALIGIDTVVTHMAAALDVPTVALFGPTLTRHWGPWPNDSTERKPYKDQGCVQRRGSITVIQKEWPCVPCNRQTCTLSGGSGIMCMEGISPEEVLNELCRLTIYSEHL